MATFLSKYNTARHIYIPMVKRAVVDFAVGADWTPAGGDVKISKDGGAAANVTNLPVAIAMGNTAIWDFSLTSTELSAAQVVVTVADSATKAVEDTAFIIETYGNASGQHPFDLATATQSVNVSSINSVSAASVTTVSANQGTTQPLNFTGTAGSALVKGDVVDIAGAAVSTSTAQLGVNVVNFGGSAGTFTSGKPDVQNVAGAVTGAVGSVTGNVGGNVTGSVGSVVGAVGSVTGAVGSVTGAVGSVTGAVGSVTGNVGGNVVGTVASVVGAVGSVTGNVGGNVVGSVASVTATVSADVKKINATTLTGDGNLTPWGPA